MVWVMAVMPTSFKRIYAHMLVFIVNPSLCQRLLCTHRQVSFGDTALLSWFLVHTRFSLCSPRLCFPSPMEVLYSNPTGL